MTIVVAESENFQKMDRVAELTAEGYGDKHIAGELGISMKEVRNLRHTYYDILQNDAEARDLARDHLHQMVRNYDTLINKLHHVLEDVESLPHNHQAVAQKISAIKSIGELDAKRVDMLQKAGLLDSAELGDELAEAEEKREILLSIIRDEICNDCRVKVANRIAQVSGQVEVISVEKVDE